MTTEPQNEQIAPDITLPLISRQELGRRLGIHPNTITALQNQGMPCFRIGGQWRYDWEACLAWVRDRNRCLSREDQFPVPSSVGE